ncbi:MAG: dephospho-CoA kinase [bacterium]
MIVGLTGGIACGKSIVADTLERMGVRVVDCDVLARELVRFGTGALQKITEVFGSRILNPDGSLDRKKLADIVFSSSAERIKLESILHPLIKERLRVEIDECKSRDEDLVIVAPLLIEAKVTDYVDVIWVVSSPIRLMIERLCKRDGISELDAHRRINSQMPVEEKIKYAHYIIDNSGTIEELKRQVTSTWEKMHKEFAAARSPINVVGRGRS